MRFLTLLIGISYLAVASATHADELSPWQPCFKPGYGKQLECAKLTLGDGGQLSVARKTAVKLGSQNPPLFVLAGGPGQASGELAVLVDEVFGPTNQYHDIYFVDRRATGDSRPWRCDVDDRDASDEKIQRELANCFAQSVWPVAQLSSTQSIDDLEALRALLGATKVNLWGGSWGTRFALLYAQQYPTSVNRMVLDGVAPVSQPVLITANAAQGAWDELVRLCSLGRECATRFPSPSQQLRDLLAALETPALVEVFDPSTGSFIEQQITRDQLAQIIRATLYAPEISGQLFYALEQAQQSRWEPLMSIAAMQNQSAESMYIGLTLSVLCAEELPRVTAEEVEAEAARGFVATSWLDFWQSACAVWPVEPRIYEPPAQLAQPTMLISGALDPVTPPSYAAIAAERLSQAIEVVVPFGGHMNSMRACLPQQIGLFFEGRDAEINTDCVNDLPPPLFMTAAYGSALGGDPKND